MRSFIEYYKNEGKVVILMPFFGIMLGMALVGFLLFPPFYTVKSGFEAIKIRLGKIIGCAHSAGFYFKIPLVDKIVVMPIRINKIVLETSAITKDLQILTVEIALNYKINDILELYKKIGADVNAIIIDPFVQESIKVVFAQYSMEHIVHNLMQAKEKIIAHLKPRLRSYAVSLIDMSFIQISIPADFAQTYDLHHAQEKILLARQKNN